MARYTLTGTLAKYCNEHVCVCACLSVCVSVCLSSSISPEPQARYLPFFVHVAYGRCSVLIRQGDEIPTGRGQFWGFTSPLTMHCMGRIGV